MKFRIYTLLLCILLMSGVVYGEVPWKTANLNLVNDHVVPRYQKLSVAADKLETSSKQLCATPNEETLETLRRSFHEIMDGWASVQHLRNGAIELFNRYHRFQLWPDKHNTGPKQLGKMLAEEDDDALRAEHFAHSSVAVQGLSALERLLFGRKKSVDRFAIDGQANYRCHLVEAISHNLAEISKNVADEWENQPPFDMLFIEGGGMNYELKTEPDISSRKEVTTVFFNNLFTQMQSIIDQKLLRAMGESAAKGKARYLESWRSLRSLRNITLNLGALESLYDVGFAPIVKAQENGENLDSQIKQAFQNVYHAASDIDQPLYHVIKMKQQRPKLEKLVAATRELQSLLTGPLPEALGISLGFNALDGD